MPFLKSFELGQKLGTDLLASQSRALWTRILT